MRVEPEGVYGVIIRVCSAVLVGATVVGLLCARRRYAGWGAPRPCSLGGLAPS